MSTNTRKFRLALTTLTLVALLLSVFGAVPAWAATSDVDNTDPSCNDTTGTPYCTIQAAIDAASNGDTINVAAGTYDEPVNIENFTGLTINGADKTTVIVKPSSTLDWGEGYGSSRQVAFRVVDSTNVVLQNMTMDFDSIRGVGGAGYSYWLAGVIYWDSTGEMSNNVFKNLSVVDDASAGYSEWCTYLRATGYTHATRADVTVSNNTFIDTGRVGINIHDYVNATVSSNTFYKTTDDFGYAVELGSESIGTISGNTIYGYDTPALSDGSESAGIYVENAFTSDVTMPFVKNVTVENNEVYDSQWGFYVDNAGVSPGDVDVVVTLDNNNFHDNDDGAAVITDEGMANGSSVSVSGGGNTLTNNGDYGYYIYTQGDGDVSVDLTGETITGHGTGVYVEDTGSPSSSSYDVTINGSNITGNTTYGVNNTVTGLTVDAENNWWGAASGPGPVGPGSGDNVSTNVDYSPWTQAMLWVEPDDGWVEEGQNIIIDVRITANDMNGVEFDLDFDPSLLHVVNVTAGSMWSGHDYNVVQNTYNNTAGTIDFAAFLQEADTDMDVTDGQVARIEFQGDDAGISALDLNDAIASTIEGEAIVPVLLEDGTLTVFGHGSVHGVVEVQGRPGDWDGALVTVSGGPGGGSYNTTVTSLDGTWSISGIVEGDYEVEVEMTLYLDGLKTGVSITDAGDTDVAQVKVLGGDCNDTDGVLPCGSGPYGINVLDATIVADEFGNTSPTDARADINDDNTVNILDAALLGGNWHKCSPVNWP